MGQVLAVLRTSLVPRLLFAAILLAVLAITWFVYRESGQPVRGLDQTGVRLEGIDLEELADAGILLTEPSKGFAPGASVSEAEAEATKLNAAVAIGSELVHLRTAGFEGEAWAINLARSDDEPKRRAPVGEPLYKVAFVDANSGKWIFSVQVDAPPEGGWPTEPPPNYVTPAAE